MIFSSRSAILVAVATTGLALAPATQAAPASPSVPAASVARQIMSGDTPVSYARFHGGHFRGGHFRGGHFRGGPFWWIPGAAFRWIPRAPLRRLPRLSSPPLRLRRYPTGPLWAPVLWLPKALLRLRYGYGYGYPYYGYGYGPGLGVVTGAILGSAIAATARPVYRARGYGGHTAYCLRRFKSYNPRTGTYLGYDGHRHPC